MTTLEKISQEIDNLKKLYSENGLALMDKGNLPCEYDSSDIESAKVKAISEAIEIVKKHLSCENRTETTRQSRDNGWTACSERMPENAKVKGAFCPKYQIMTAYGVTEGWYNPDQDGWYALFWFMTERFLKSEINFKNGDVAKVVFIPDGSEENVIAWKPLPESYKPPVESAEEKSMREREEFFKDGE